MHSEGYVRYLVRVYVRLSVCYHVSATVRNKAPNKRYLWLQRDMENNFLKAISLKIFIQKLWRHLLTVAVFTVLPLYSIITVLCQISLIYLTQCAEVALPQFLQDHKMLKRTILFLFFNSCTPILVSSEALQVLKIPFS